MSGGRLIAVVGPSGVGKDSVIAGVLAAAPELRPVTRTITRRPGLAGEHYRSVSQAQFESAVASGQFCLHWSAHGLSYGIPAEVLAGVKQGRQYIANLSRSALGDAVARFPDCIVILLTASPQTLAERLCERGRESQAEIAARLARRSFPMPAGLDYHSVRNDGALRHTVEQFLALLSRQAARERTAIDAR